MKDLQHEMENVNELTANEHCEKTKISYKYGRKNHIRRAHTVAIETNLKLKLNNIYRRKLIRLLSFNF